MPSPHKQFPIQTCVRMTKRQFKGLRDWAKDEGATPSWLIRNQIDQHIKNLQKRSHTTEEVGKGLSTSGHPTSTDL